MPGEGEMQGEMECVTTNLIDRFNEKVVEEIPLLVGNSLWRYRGCPSDGWSIPAQTQDKDGTGTPLWLPPGTLLPWAPHSPPCAGGRSPQL